VLFGSALAVRGLQEAVGDTVQRAPVHPMKWQSEEHVGLAEAAEWARHFGQLEKDMDSLLAELFGVPSSAMDKWINPGRYVSGRDLVDAGLAEMVDLKTFRLFEMNGAVRDRKKRVRVAH
jgi:hypothetical protein